MNSRTMALIFGIFFVGAGVGGFIPGITDMTQTPHPDLDLTSGYGHALGMWPINILHNIVHIVFGLWGLAASRSYGGARTYFRSVAVIYALFVVMGLVSAAKLHTAFGFVPLYGGDVWLHVVLSAVAAYFGFMARDHGVGDRT